MSTQSGTSAEALSQQTKLDLARLKSFQVPFAIVDGAFDADTIVCPTPDRMAVEVPEASPVQAAVLSAMSTAGLSPLSYRSENSGQLSVNITPQRPDLLDLQSYEKSVGRLRGHTDGSFNPNWTEYGLGDQSYSPSPDYLVLGAYRNPMQYRRGSQYLMKSWHGSSRRTRSIDGVKGTSSRRRLHLTFRSTL